MDEQDMTTPVTRGELREELASFEKKFDTKLELWAGAILDRVDKRFAVVDQRFEQIDQRFAQIDQRFAQIDQRFAQIDQQFAQINQRFAQIDQQFAGLSIELAGHARAIAEAVRAEVRGIDDKYTDLPERVRKLEDAVFTPPARKRPARRRRSA